MHMIKRLTLALIATTAFAAPLSLATVADARDGRGNGKGRGEGQGRMERGGPPGRPEFGAYRVNPRDAGPPYGRAQGRGIARGGYLPPRYRDAPVEDYGRYRLRPPPRGYDWYRYGDSYLLVSPRDGQIFDMIE